MGRVFPMWEILFSNGIGQAFTSSYFINVPFEMRDKTMRN